MAAIKKLESIGPRTLAWRACLTPEICPPHMCYHRLPNLVVMVQAVGAEVRGCQKFESTGSPPAWDRVCLAHRNMHLAKCVTMLNLVVLGQTV